MITKELKQLIHANPLVYGLQFAGYEGGKIQYTEPDQYNLKKAKKDLQLFRERQEAINKRTRIAQGDWIKRPDGTYGRVSVASPPYLVQATESGRDGSVHVYRNGSASFSGSCGPAIEADKIKPTDEMREGQCWIFSDDYATAHNGVNWVLKFKVWEVTK